MEILGKRLKNSDFSSKVIKFEDGYREVGYFKNILLLEDHIENVNNDNQDMVLNEEYGIYDMLKYKQEFIRILSELDDNKVYKMIFKINMIINDKDGGEYIDRKTTQSIMIHRNSSIEYILFKFQYLLVDLLEKYDIPDFIDMSVFIKEWIDSSELSNIKSLYDILSKKEGQFLNKHVINKSKELDDNNQLLHNSKLGNIFIKNKPSLLIKGLNYGDIITNESNLLKYKSLIGESYITNIDNNNNNNNNSNNESVNELTVTNKLVNENIYKLNYGAKGKNYIVKVNNIDDINNQVSVYMEINDNNVTKLIKVEEWNDNINNSYNSCIRKIKDSTKEILFINNEIERVDVKYNCKKLQESYLDLDKNIKIGSFDIETYLDEKNSVIPYYIGCRTGDKRILYKYSEFKTPEEMVLKFIEDLMIPENHNRFYYALNMSNFDGIIVLKSLIKTSHLHDLKLNTLSKNDGTIISVVIKKVLKNKKIIKITLSDSFHLLPFSLDKLGKVFNKNNKSNSLFKGNYPHDFINKFGLYNAMNYKGSVPNIKYFNNISKDSYQSIVNRINNSENGIWDSEKELINYLIKDIDILYNVMDTFATIIYQYFNINITRIRTFSGLAFLIFTSKYYNSKNKTIYLLSGKIDKYIREGYYGGVVDNFVNYIDKPVYKYDINSHYPNQMHNKAMPGGIPRYSTENNLDLIFGFVRAKVTAPTSDLLRVPVLPINKDGQLITFRGTEEGTWFSEELKYAKNLGYNIIVKDCIQFDKVYGLFDDFTKDLYKLKSQAELEKDDVSRLIFKLILNSLYGRWGLKDLNVEYKIIDNIKLNKLNKTEHIDILFSSDKLSFVKSSGPVYPEIIQLFEKEKLIAKKDNKFNEPKPWGRNVSAVQHSAAITAYARIEINKFKNLENNLYLGGDTDSFILQYPLESSYVGPELGKAKLECVITEAFFHSKKSYLICTDKGEIIIKMKGIKSPNLLLNRETFVKLFKGEDVPIKQLQFKKDYKNMDVKIEHIIKTIKGISDINIIKLVKDKFKDNNIKYTDIKQGNLDNKDGEILRDDVDSSIDDQNEKIECRSIIIYKKPNIEIVIYNKPENQIIIYNKPLNLDSIPIIYIHNLKLDLYKKMMVRPSFSLIKIEFSELGINFDINKDKKLIKKIYQYEKVTDNKFKFGFFYFKLKLKDKLNSSEEILINYLLNIDYLNQKKTLMSESNLVYQSYIFDTEDRNIFIFNRKFKTQYKGLNFEFNKEAFYYFYFLNDKIVWNKIDQISSVNIELTPPLFNDNNDNNKIKSLDIINRPINLFFVKKLIEINNNLFQGGEEIYSYDINKLIEEVLSLIDRDKEGREYELLKNIYFIFPFLFKNNFLIINNSDINEFVVKIYYHYILINNKLKQYFIENIKFELKIFFLNSHIEQYKDIIEYDSENIKKYILNKRIRKYKLIEYGNRVIDYNNIYLIINNGKEKLHYKLELLKLKRDNTISIRTENIIDKYLLSNINDKLKDYLISEGINIENDIIKDRMKYLDKLNINLTDILKEVIPNKIFFDINFDPHINYIKKYNINKGKWELIRFDFKNKNNWIERYNLFEINKLNYLKVQRRDELINEYLLYFIFYILLFILKDRY
uniref:DNA-directed DNA polymerase n=1 Tax=Moniliophthora roreri (strain MCA 2997) TaxID=1381753 RepID=F2WVN4_MONRO|nr:dnapol [Moniliophthora roreri]